MQATISGKQLTQLWELPLQLFQQGDLWFVDNNSQLSKSNADVEFGKGRFDLHRPYQAERGNWRQCALGKASVKQL
ncbi:hypothetical protein O9929_11590 [Vibrio lentus]|nr:hypothetical protein [Vibrio lentus]